jgi:predicted amidohydrolase YtcJ
LGGVALPGFIDSHVHLTATGLDLLALDSRKFENILDLLAKISELDLEQDGLIRIWGYDYDNFRERRYPTLKELDQACPRNLLWINHIESHGTLVNTNSLKAMGLESAESLLVGEYNQQARQFFLDLISSLEREEAITAAADLAVSKGVTTVHAMEGGRLFHDQDIKVLLGMQGRLPIDVVIYPQVIDVQWAHEQGFAQIGGCLPLDGSSGVYTAALTKPYYQRGDTGLIYFSREQIQALLLDAQRIGMQVAMHACGDAAIDLFLDAVEYALAHYPTPIPHRIEHFEIPREDQVGRSLELGVILSMQPSFDLFWGGPHGDYARTLGPDRWQDTNPVGWAVGAGLIVAGGSDSGVTPLNPLLGIQAAVSHRNRQQQVTLDQAVAMFTENGALAARQTDRGRLEPGLRADIVVLDQDLWEQSVHQIRDVKVKATIHKGRIVWPKEKTARGGN